MLSDDPRDTPVSAWSFIISAVLIIGFFGMWLFAIEQAKEKRGDRVDRCTLLVIAIGFTVVFSVLVYFYLKPLINDFFEESPDAEGKHSERRHD